MFWQSSKVVHMLNGSRGICFATLSAASKNTDVRSLQVSDIQLECMLSFSVYLWDMLEVLMTSQYTFYMSTMICFSLCIDSADDRSGVLVQQLVLPLTDSKTTVWVILLQGLTLRPQWGQWSNPEQQWYTRPDLLHSVSVMKSVWDTRVCETALVCQS